MTNEKFKQLENIVIEIESNSRVRMIVDNEERLKGQSEKKKGIYFIKKCKKGQTSPYPKES